MGIEDIPQAFGLVVCGLEAYVLRVRKRRPLGFRHGMEESRG